MTPRARATFHDYARRSARAYEEQLRSQLERHGTPDVAPEVSGRRAAILAAAGPAWSDDVGPFHDTDGARWALGGITKQAVSQRVNDRRLLGLRLAPDGSGRQRLVYPTWQFHTTVLRDLPAVLSAAGYDPTRSVTGWTIATWFTTQQPELGNATPTQLLRAGHVDRVLAVAGELAASLGVEERSAVHAQARTGVA